MKEGFECSIKSEISYFYINLLKKKKKKKPLVLIVRILLKLEVI